MKKNVAVIGAHVAVLGAVSLLSGCFTSNPDSPYVGAAARTRGTIKHVHPGKDSVPVDNVTSTYTGRDFTPFPDDGTDIITGDPLLDYDPPEITYNPPPVEQYDTYIVAPGDILSRIAAKYDTRTSTLVAINNLPNADVIYVGQKLKVPTKSGNSGGGLTTTTNINPGREAVQKGEVYVIASGDTLSGIAVRAGVSIDDLRQLNNISGDMIRAGDKLLIPEGGRIPSGGSGTTNAPNEVRSGPDATPLSPVTDPPVSNDDANGDFAGYRMEPAQVYPSDTLDTLAEYYGAKKEDILKANNLTDESQIVKGMKLKIPVKD